MKKFILKAIHSVKEDIDRSPFQKTSTVDMAAGANIGKNVLQKGFRLLFEKNIQEYRQHKRMEAACILLEEGELTMKQVAYKCGYSTQGNFSYAFKKMHGLTPTEYQNRA